MPATPEPIIAIHSLCVISTGFSFISFDKEPSILTSSGSSKFPLEQWFKHKLGQT